MSCTRPMTFNPSVLRKRRNICPLLSPAFCEITFLLSVRNGGFYRLLVCARLGRMFVCLWKPYLVSIVLTAYILPNFVPSTELFLSLDSFFDVISCALNLWVQSPWAHTGPPGCYGDSAPLSRLHKARRSVVFCRVPGGVSWPAVRPALPYSWHMCVILVDGHHNVSAFCRLWMVLRSPGWYG
jgi:hypothetical protein